ncbi:putative 28S ribosomal protein S18a, mitochondrial-like [Apostichopus japonicus]|uniref:Putative 28S ribosomal protein S18a, mitochondrial-like n=1 Tax=Stichopus japonicus TaxID=307972 RepID=A0A2G8L4P6_STIJA|nr:putative 28S ribosomal protein S18a, mitochondrial-like [Apostichopus japonicus]
MEVEGVVVNDTVSYAGGSTSQRACPICSRNLQVSYKDVLILDQFVSKKTGKILPRRVTGVCTKQHRQLEDCIDKAQKSGLLPPPDLSSIPLPPKDMRLPQGTFHTFYRSNTRGTKRKE